MDLQKIREIQKSVVDFLILLVKRKKDIDLTLTWTFIIEMTKYRRINISKKNGSQLFYKHQTTNLN